MMTEGRRNGATKEAGAGAGPTCPTRCARKGGGAGSWVGVVLLVMGAPSSYP